MYIEKLFPKIKFSIILIFGASLLASCDSDTNVKSYDLEDLVANQEITDHHPHINADEVIKFGFDLRASPQEDARQYLPFLRYLEKETGYKFRLHFTSKSSNIIEDLGNNHVQFAAIGAESFIRANSEYEVVPLVRGLNNKGKAEYQSVFVVLPNSNIKKLSHIKGKHLAFGARSSTQGHLIPRIVLSKSNIDLKTFASFTYTGSHQNCANSVMSGKADVCVLQDTMARTMENQGLLRSIYTSNFFPSSGIAANKNVSSDVVKKVKQALLNFKPKGKDQPGLYHWDRTEMPLGFAEASIADYRDLREWSIKLGFMQVKKELKK